MIKVQTTQNLHVVFCKRIRNYLQIFLQRHYIIGKIIDEIFSNEKLWANEF